MKTLFIVAGLMVADSLRAQESPVALPPFSVYSTTVANQSQPGFTSPASALRFEPLVDLESRNVAEAQSDVTIQGDIFENTASRSGPCRSLIRRQPLPRGTPDLSRHAGAPRFSQVLTRP